MALFEAIGKSKGQGGTRSDDLRALAVAILRKAGRRFWIALTFLLAGSVLESLSLLLLIPILHLVGSAENGFTLTLPDHGPLRWLVPDGSVALSSVLSLLVLLIAAQAVFLRFKSVYLAEFLADFVNQNRIELFESIGRARWQVLSQTRAADLEHILNGEVERIQGATFSLIVLLQTGIILLVYASVSLMISPAMTLAATILGTAMFLVLRPFRHKAASFGNVVSDSRKNQFRTVSEFLGGLKVAKSYNAEQSHFDRLRRILEQMKIDGIDYVRASTFAKAVFQTSVAILLVVFVYVSLTMSGLSVGRVAVLLLIFARVVPRFMEIQSHVQQVLTNLPAFAANESFKQRFVAEREAPALGKTGTGKPLLEREITLENVSFAYEGSSKDHIINDLSCTIPAGKITALIGPSGAGKSTLADMLLGLLTPVRGSISIDGVELEADMLRDWRNEVAYVPQDVFLLHDTVSENLRMAAPEASEAELWHVLRLAGAAEFVAQFENKLNTILGDRGTRLSGGERQRIALARALLRKPRLLVLDEATSALDWKIQSLITASIGALRGSMTIVTVAHRPSMITFSDWVVAIQDGELVETGSYEMLTSRQRSYLSTLLAGERAGFGKADGPSFATGSARTMRSSAQGVR